MSYQVLARKWRPTTFAEVAGQDHVIRTLQNALRMQRVGHAYLFVGPRGTGKTTTARIFAKALNCEQGIVPEPCCQCASCRQITAGNSLDIVEIDGASHNKVEDVRELRENAQYTPSQSRFKIYIIDEVHMLSNAAWNALLKILEEPPPHIKFFFATTEPHKVLATILSRCQRFDLKRLPAGLIAERLEQIAKKEQVNIDKRALAAIARAADGGMRDGQSIFDQIISFCSPEDGEQTISEQDVINVFGLASGTELKNLIRTVLQDDQDGLIRLIQAIADAGRDLERVYADLLVFTRNLMIAVTCSRPEELLDTGDTETEDLLELAKDTDSASVQRMLDKLIDYESWLRNALNKRVYFEVILIKITRHVHSVAIDQVINRLNQFRQNPNQLKANEKSQKTSEKTQATPPSSPDRDTGQATVESKHSKVSTPSPTTPPKDFSDSNPEPPSAQQQGKNQSAENSTGSGERINYSPFDGPAINPRETKEERNSVETEYLQDEQHSWEVQDQQQESSEEPYPPGDTLHNKPERTINETEDNSEEDNSIDQCATLWHKLIEQVSRDSQHHSLKNPMQEMRPISHLGNALIVAYDEEFPQEHVKTLQKTQNFRFLENTLKKITGREETRLVIKKWNPALSEESAGKKLQSSPEVRERVKKDPFVKTVISLFGGEIVDVRG